MGVTGIGAGEGNQTLVCSLGSCIRSSANPSYQLSPPSVLNHPTSFAGYAV
jgi:hypothetical protein